MMEKSSFCCVGGRGGEERRKKEVVDGYDCVFFLLGAILSESDQIERSGEKKAR